MDFKDSIEKLQEKLSSQKHYTDCVIEPLEYITANGLSFLEGNVIKYISRYKNKNGKEDLIKARVYLDKLIGLFDDKSEVELQKQEETPGVLVGQVPRVHEDTIW